MNHKDTKGTKGAYPYRLVGATRWVAHVACYKRDQQEEILNHKVTKGTDPYRQVWATRWVARVHITTEVTERLNCTAKTQRSRRGMGDVGVIWGIRRGDPLGRPKS